MSRNSAEPADARQRASAVETHRSVIVQAPAGSGKTTLLVERVLNLLSVVDRPEEILAITFTRKAAAEMQERVLSAINGTSQRARTIRDRSRTLGWHLIEQPSRLRIQTIDGFAAGLVQRLPTNSRFGANVRVLEDAQPLYQEAVNRVFERLHRSDPLCGELISILELFDNDYARARTSMITMLARRDQWLEVAMATLRAGRDSDDVALDTEVARHNALAGAIEHGIDALHRAAFADIESALSTQLRSELALNAAHAAQRLGRPWPWPELPDDLDGWRFIADLVVTQTDLPRSRFGAAQGFDASRGREPGAKARLKALIEDLTRQNLVGSFATLRKLPTTPLERAEVQAIIAVATGLSLAAIELSALFHRDQAIDFTELTFAAHRALGESDAPTDLALAIDYRIKHLLIDEFQDTSAIQHRLLARLVEEWQPDDGRSLFIVGDPMQSIYRFRDADVALFQRTRRSGIGAKRLEPIRLTSNFRSSAALVDWCNEAFAAAFGHAEDTVLGQVAFSASTSIHTARSDDGCRTYLVDSDDDREAEAAALVRVIERVRDDHPTETIAILVRNRSHLERILPRLNARQIAWVGTDIDLLAERPVVDDLLSLLKALSSDADHLAWLALLRTPFVGMSLRDLEIIAQFATGPAVVVRDVTRIDDLSDDGRQRLDRIRPVLQRAQRSRGQIRVRQWLQTTFIQLGGVDAYDAGDTLDHVERFLSLIDDSHARILDLPRLERAVARLFAQTSSRAGSVNVMTIHRAKGLEFDHVFLPGLQRVNRTDDPPTILWRPQGDDLLLGVLGTQTPSSIYQWLRHEERNREANEQIRLLYVAATRARRSLHLFGASDTTGDGLRPPPARSLLAPIWSIVAARAEIIRSSDKLNQQAATSIERRALKTNYVWRPPTRQPDLAAYDQPAPSPQHQRLEPIVDSYEFSIGVVLRRTLAALKQLPEPDSISAFIRSCEPQWHREVARLGVTEPRLSACVTEIARQMSLVLADHHGRWILEPRAGALNDAHITGYHRNSLFRIIVDRTFVDPAGEYWAINYNSSRPGSLVGDEEFLAHQQHQYGAGMHACFELMSNLARRPIRLALYFTALPRLLNINDTVDLSPGAAENAPS